MQLFLSGGGGAEDAFQLNALFSNKVDKTKPILYIPIAIDKIKHPYSDCLKWLNSTLNPLGIEHIELWTEQDLRKKSEKELTQFGGIFIGGGNTYYLLKELRESGFDKKLEKIVSKNIPVYGGSAGAIIFGKTIATSPDENKVKLKTLQGLNLLLGKSLFCHYNKPKDKLFAKELVETGKVKGALALSENSGLYLTGDSIQVIGPGSVYNLEKRKRYLPGKIIR